VQYRSSSSWLLPLALGAAAMYFLDPERGARRRALVRDKALWASRKTRDGVDALGRDFRNRLYGARAEMRGWMESGAVDDGVLQARVRAALGRVCSHPSAITVLASEGQVTLSGVILSNEHSQVMREVSRVRGVQSVNDLLDPHDVPGTIPALQGGSQWQY
jgi:hypothetical protein